MDSKISWFGIDFGTTNSAAVSFMGATQETVQQFNFGDDIGRPLPSVVAINKQTGEVVTGREAKERSNVLVTDYEYFSSIKSIIAEDKTWTIAGKKWSPEDIASEVFKSLKARIERDKNNSIDEAVVAVPVGFSSKKKERLRNAARKAGISIKMFISEPTAAFCSNYTRLKDCKNVAVFDWGGGTLDIAVLRVEQGQIFELSTEGMNLGGDYIDKKLAEKMHHKFSKGRDAVISFEELDPVTKDQLILKCEKAKCDFSDEDLVSITINKYGTYGSVRDTVDYDFFSLLVEKEVHDALDCLERAIKKANLNKVNLDCILCVGGSSRLRPFREKLEEVYGEELVYYPEEVMWDIAKGAAIISTRPGCYALNKSIGILLNDGKYYPLLEKGQKIPCKERTMNFGVLEGSKEARFIFSDSEHESDRTFIEHFVVPIRGFCDEYLTLSCYIDPDFVFKLNVKSNRMHDQVARVWSYDKVKIFYVIEGDPEDGQ